MRKLRLGLPKSRRVWIVILFIILALAALGAYLLQPRRPPTTVSVTRGDLRATVSANARVRALRSARLALPYSGSLAEVRVREGDTVKAGDVLAELEPDEFDRRIQQAELALASRRLELERAQAAPSREDLDIAQNNLKKAALALAVAEDNYKKNVTSANRAAKEMAQADYDNARASFDRVARGAAEESVQLLKNSATAAQLELDAARAARRQAQLRAPFDAVVTDVTARAGELIGGYNPFITVTDLSQLELLAEIDEIDVGAVAAGQSVEIRLDAFPGKTLKGELLQVFPAASTERGASIYRARISFAAGGLAVRPGMGATLKIATVERKNVLLVPARAIKSAGTQKIVTALVDGVQRNVVVVTGLADGNQTEIVSGLGEGTVVVVE